MDRKIIHFIYNQFENNIECDVIVKKVMSKFTENELLELSKYWTSPKLKDFPSIEQWLTESIEKENVYYWDTHRLNNLED